jgi:hypothetical protein
VISTDDYIQIQQVDSLYAHVLDRHLWDRLDEVWAEDGGYDGRASGREYAIGIPALRAYLSTSHQPLIHLFTNHAIERVEEDGRVARGRSRWLIVWEDNSIGAGDCDDIWKKTEKGWRLYRRTSHQMTRKAPPPAAGT